MPKEEADPLDSFPSLLYIISMQLATIATNVLSSFLYKAAYERYDCTVKSCRIPVGFIFMDTLFTAAVYNGLFQEM